jgi:transposase
MIAAEKRKAVFFLHQEGMSVREISRRLGISRNAVRVVIGQQGAMPLVTRREKCPLDA